MELKVGDIVEWCGIKGKVDSIGNYMKVHFYVDGIADNLIDWGPQYTFNKDGKQFDWHKEPSLKLIERPKQKVKKYKVLFVDIYDEWQLSSSYYETVEKFDMHNIYKVKMLLEQTMVEDEE